MKENDIGLPSDMSLADVDRIEAYLRMLDRILLYTIASQTMPREALKGVSNLWNLVIKKSIDAESSQKTEYLEGTAIGKLSLKNGETDGESHRLKCLEILEIANKIAKCNLQIND